MQLFETTRLSIFKKISSLPVFAHTYTNELFSILPAVIRAHQLIKLGEKSQSFNFIRASPRMTDLGRIRVI